MAQTFGAPQPSSPSCLRRADSTRSTQTASSSRRASVKDEKVRRSSTKPTSLQLNSTAKPTIKDNQPKSTASSILDSINRKLDRFLDLIRQDGYVLPGNKYLAEAEDSKSLPPIPSGIPPLELTYLRPEPLSSTKPVPRSENLRQKIANPGEAWKRIGSTEYRFVDDGRKHGK